MATTPPFHVQQLLPGDELLMEALLSVFADAFEDHSTYRSRPPGRDYLRRLLGGDSFVALVAREGATVAGGLAAYELRKFEQERSEFYIYDLAVAAPYRRRGVATALIRELQRIAAGRAAWVIFVQADPPDAPALALYSKLGTREEVLHFDIPVPRLP